LGFGGEHVPAKPLTAQQEKFAQGIASGVNQSDAYRQAYKAGKMTAKQVHEEACKLAAHPKVAPRIKELTAAAADVAVLEGAEIIKEIARVAFSDMGGIMHADGRVKLPHELDPATRAAVSSFELNQYGEVKYKFWDKNTALTNAAKIRGLFEQDNKQKAPTVFTQIELVGVKPKPSA
jgi:hypothetical protein